MQKITPFLSFDGKAEEAMRSYVSIFKNSKVGAITRYGDAGPMLQMNKLDIARLKQAYAQQ
jgi:predicted 3-demethylubiquinone-9 3-methyltransferase (glyoxalase superfamily)